MFVRTAVRKNKDGSSRSYLLICESEWVNGRPRQRVVANLGRLDEAVASGTVDKLVGALSRFQQHQQVRRAAKQVGATRAPSWGPLLVFRRLWEELGLPQALRRAMRERSVTRPVEAAVFAMVMHRLLDPGSKLRLHSEWLPTVYWPAFEQLRLQHLYRALDDLAIHHEAIEAALWSRQVDLFNYQLDLVFVDTTTAYWVGEGAEGVAAYGHSKDRRPDHKQLVIGLLMTSDGIPVGHEVFPGNCADVEAFAEMLAALRRRFAIRQACIVADRGMVSETTLAALEKAGYTYIVGVRMRRLKAARTVLARAGRYHVVSANLHVKNVVHAGQRYVVCYNPQQAARDQRARREMVAKLEGLLAKGATRTLVGNRGYRRFLHIEHDAVAIDDGALAAAERYDGRFVLRTNRNDLSAAEVAQAYKSLWRVERAFRELKSGLDIRPMFHWTESRVLGHVFVCFMALVMETQLLRALRSRGCKSPYRKVMTELGEVRAINLEVEGTRYLVRTDLSPDAYAAFQAVGARPPGQVQPSPAVAKAQPT
jgi:hypothetical protein